MAISSIKAPYTLLCMDTSGAFCTVGIVSYTPRENSADDLYTPHDIRVLAETTTPMTRGHAEHIMPAIVNILKLTNTPVADLAGVAATVGPGTFTGIRIGLATAKGLCLPHKIPCIGVDNAHAMVGGASDMDACTVIGETKRTDYYVSRYENGAIVNHQSLCFDDVVSMINAPTSITSVPIMGDGVERFIQQWHGEYPNTPPPPVLAYTPPLGVVDIAISALNAPLPPAPLYVRPPDVQPPKSGLVAQHSLKPKMGKRG